MSVNSHVDEVYTGADSRVVREGEDLVVSATERTPGSKAPFHAVYHDADRSRRYGWFCASCGSVATVMDPMGRIECVDCGNRRLATRWDAAYL